MIQLNSLVFRKSFGFSALAAAGACAACCAAPFLVTAGVGGGVAAAIAGCIRPGAEFVLAGAIGISVAGVMALRARTRRVAHCETRREPDGGCGCVRTNERAIFSTPSPPADAPIVCTADLDDKPTIQEQLDGYRAAFRHLRSSERFDGGVRWVFASRPGLDVELRTLAEKEHRCCSFFEFEVRAEADAIIWETRAGAGAEPVLAEFARLPERLAAHPRGSETQPIKRAIGDAGLKFAADAPPSK